MATNERFSGIPQVERLLSDPEVEAYLPLVSRPLALRAVTTALAGERRRAAADPSYLPTERSCRAAALAALEALDMRRVRPLMNGTGIALNTNLGRSPLSATAWEAARAANVGYASVEYDLAAGKRGTRGGLCAELASALAGAEAALVVNNNAAGVLLALAALSKDRETIVARGEQVQIGGGFRVPEILELAGARFKEVGTTNVVTQDDYRSAVGPETACALIVHTANFAIRGFASKPSVVAVVDAMGGLPVIVDQGSGCSLERMPGESSARSYLAAGCDLVCFSADKLLGGPQAGIIAGKAVFIARLAAHPLYRVFRPGKTIYALLERVLVERLNGEPSAAYAALSYPVDELKRFARKIKSRLPKGCSTLVDTQAASGGGSGPDEAFESVGLRVEPSSTAQALQTALRQGPDPLVAMVRDGAVVIDMATLIREDPQRVADAVNQALARSASLRARAERFAAESAEPGLDGS